MLLLILLELWRNWQAPAERDFLSFWAAGVLAWQGNAAAAYDVAAHKAVQSALLPFQGILPFVYPPAFLLVLGPLGALPYPAAMAAWVLGTFALYLLLARRLFPGSGWLAAGFPPTLLNAVVGQNGFITAGLFIAGLQALERRPFAGGLLLGCLVIKPQLGLMLPLAFLATRNGRALVGAALSACSMLLLGFLAFGAAATGRWIATLSAFSSHGLDGAAGWHKLASVYGALRGLGTPLELALGLHLAVASAAAALVWQVWSRRGDVRCKGAVLAAATMLASPYLYIYDAVLLVVPVLWLASRGARPIILLLLCTLPLLTLAQSFWLATPINLNPLLAIGCCLLIARQVAEPAPGRCSETPLQPVPPRPKARYSTRDARP